MVLPTQTLLLIEDCLPDRELYRRCLLSDSDCTYRVLEANSIAEGLQVYRSQSIDAILLNDMLPDGTGLEFLQALQTTQNGGSPPVVMVAGEGDARIAVQAIKLGAEDYLVKRHLTSKQLQLTMRSAIENAQLRQELRQSDDRFRVSIENMLDCFGIYSAVRDAAGQIIDFRFDYLNSAALTSNGMTLADMSKTLCELFPAHRETSLFDDYCRVVETGEPLVKENLIYSDTFGVQHLTRAYDIHASKLGDGFVASWRDITEKKQTERDRDRMEAELRESAERFHTLAQAVPSLLFEADAAGLNTWASEQWCHFTGQTLEQVRGTGWTAAIHPDDLSANLERWTRSTQEGISFEFKQRLRRFDGEYRWVIVRAVPMRNEQGQVYRWVGSLTEIDAIVHSEARLQESEERLRLGVQVAGVALAKVDYSSNRVELSPEAAVLYGLPGDELVISRDRLHATFHPDEQEEMAQIIERVIDPEGEGWFAREHRVVWQTGEVRWLSVRKQVFFARAGVEARPSYAVLAAIDITDRKEAELDRSRLLAEAEAACKEAEAANRSKDEFVAIVAHELRSPLNSIQGWAKLLQSRKFNETTLFKALDTIVRNTEAQVQLVEDLLDISRLVRGTLTLNLAPVNLATVIDAALDIVRPQAQAKQIQIGTKLRLPPHICGDFYRLQQIVINLLTNAIKFTPPGGQVEIQLSQVNAQIQLCVRDTGKGIPPEFLPRIFERFQQGQKNTGSKDGLGLGLAIVKNLVELHHGTITAESSGIDQGTTFTVQFPLLSTPAILPAQLASNTSDTSSLAGICVLVVDDEPDQVDLITFVLEEAGAKVQSATNGSAALETLSQFKPDLLISDLAMPLTNGYELLQQVRLRPEGEIPAIVLTAYASTTYEERSLQAGFQAHLTKPVDSEVLIATILNLMVGRKS